MSYYVASSGFLILPEDKEEEAYEALVNLNKRDDLKLHNPSTQTKPENSFSVASDPNKYFYWMEWNYDEFLTDTQSILERLGFYAESDGKGRIFIDEYSNRKGHEELFLASIAHLIEDNGEIRFESEDGTGWKWVISDGRMEVHTAVVNDSDETEYVFSHYAEV